MAKHFDIHYRLEPRPSHRTDLQRGFMAEIADPAWLVGRQWQMGEHQGEDAASPVLVRVRYSRRPMLPSASRPEQRPGDTGGEPITPAEAIIEGEEEDWWTTGRRVRIGLTAQQAVDGLPMTEAERAALRLHDLPEPYAPFAGGYDGRKLCHKFQAGELPLPAALFADVPIRRRDNHWAAAELRYDAVEFPITSADPPDPQDTPRLVVAGHGGGEIDWWSADAAGDWSITAPDDQADEQLAVQPARFSYPGAPNPRWWQIEDARVDIGGFPPDRSHFASLLLLDLVLAHSDDWFTLALGAQIGDVVTIKDLVVEDLFGEQFSWADYPALRPPSDWSLFKVRNLDPDSLVIWPSVAVPIAGEALEEIALGVDEDANVMWAVEERAEGLRLTGSEMDAPQGPTVTANPTLQVSTSTGYFYRPSTFIPHHWHPYIIQPISGRRMFVQSRLVDYTAVDPGETGRLAPAPIAELLFDPSLANGQGGHHLNPSVVPTTGLRLDRRYILARRTDGLPVLWVQRQRLPLFSPPARPLRFDVLEEKELIP